MAYLTLLLITTILTVANGATSLYCSDVQSPASGSHSTDLSQVTTLQYCIIDNCTIMRTDTGQQLDIVYTTESLLIVTPIDGHTSMVIVKIDNEIPCLQHHSTALSITDILIGAFFGSLTLLMMIMAAYILIVHLLFKELRTLFGKLLILYSLSILSMCGSSVVLSMMHRQIMVNSQIVCHTGMIMFTIAYTWVEISATNILTHLAYIMYRCYNLKPEISNKKSKFLFRCYNAHAFITLILLFFLTIAYDWRTGNAKNTLLPNGHCNFIDQYSYNTIYLSDIFAFINKFAQITMFSAYLVYFYKLKVIMNNLQSFTGYNQELFRIAIAMGATVGLSHFIWIPVLFDSQYSNILGVSGVIFLFIQQTVITTSFLSTEKMSNFCRAYFSRQ